MILVRDAGRRLWHPALRWPRRLRGKWLGLILLVAVLFSYELFDLWALPRATAWLIVGYFAAALVVDVLFSGASFCKHLCPIGHFTSSLDAVADGLQARTPVTCARARRSTASMAKRRIGRSIVRIVRVVGFRAGRSDLRFGSSGFGSCGERPERLPVLRGCELALFMPANGAT